MQHAKAHSPSAARNRDEVLSALTAVLPAAGVVLEIASGTGQHAAYFVERLAASIEWQPTDRSVRALASIAARRAESRVRSRIRPPLQLDVRAGAWPVDRAAAVVAINMLHISPWSACEGLLAGASRVLEVGAPLFFYGAFLRDGVSAAPSNLEFDRELRRRDPAFGVRRLEAVEVAAAQFGFVLDRVAELPNNNCGVTFRRDASPTRRWLRSS